VTSSDHQTLMNQSADQSANKSVTKSANKTEVKNAVTERDMKALDSFSVTQLKGVGEKMAQRLASLGLETVQDVLFHLPTRYQDRTRVKQIGSLLPGDEAVIELTIDLCDVVFRRRRSLLCKGSDGTGSITLRFFHFSQKQVDSLRRGVRIRCFSEVRRGPGGIEMVHPEYTFVSDSAPLPNVLTPFYAATEGVNQLTLRKLTDQALVMLETARIDECLPAELLQGYDLPDPVSALQVIHRPPASVDVNSLLEGTHPSLQRFVIEELVAHRIGMKLQRMRRRDRRSPVVAPSGELLQRFLDSLPYELTGAQTRVSAEIAESLRSSSPMLRLLQGDVGAGKTVVAAYAAALAVECGMQVALMAPTEILAEQHLLNLSEWFEPLGVRIGWLSGKLRQSQRRDAIESIALGWVLLLSMSNTASACTSVWHCVTRGRVKIRCRINLS